MSDIKYRSEHHLLNTIAYERRRANTAKLRIEACQNELEKRGFTDIREQTKPGELAARS